MEIDMGAKPRSALRSLWKKFGEGLMWTGFAWNGMYPPYAWKELTALPDDQPCLPALSEAELAQWAALVKQLQ
ncbi:hypothetical protein [Streptomyces sp. NBC_01244]|uniref:hypothetical protein n=1 Tax=Streptomyces sp. NBC_01244 TaxID=2903797 RepID=UPI002E1450E3|nr:hypothetical protein OG247_43200 [Streptomyces sp. NBC_01244]